LSIVETKDGVILTLFVIPNSNTFKVEFGGEEIVVRSTKEPVKGRVNKEIIKEFTKLLHVKVDLVAGLTSRQKKMIALGITKPQVEQALRT